MRPSINLVLVGVGAWIAFSNTAPGVSETMPSQPQKFSSPSSAGSLPRPIPDQNSIAPPSSVVEATPLIDRGTVMAQTSPVPIAVPVAVASNKPEWLLAASAPLQPTLGVEPSATPPFQSRPPQTIVPTQAAPPLRTAQLIDPTQTIPDRPVPPLSTPSSGLTLDSQLDIPNIVPPIGPARPGPAPDYLNPDPNPLLFPTRPDEVRLRGVQPITLRQAIELAERNSRTLQISIQQLERSRAGLRQQQASLYPTVGVQAGITTSRSASSSFSSGSSLSNLLGTNNSRNSASFSGSVNLDYSIFTFGLRPAQIRAAEQQVRSDELQVEITREQLRLDVATDYYSLQEADESVRIAEVSVQTNQINRRDAERLQIAGLGTRFSVLQADVELANARQQLSNAQAQVQIRRRQLAVRIAAPLTIDLATADPIDVAGNWNLSLDDSIILAIKNRAELAQFLAQRNLSAEQRRVALASLAPAITVSAQYNILDSFNDQFGAADGYSATLGLRWNFFDGGAARARADQQTANIAIAELNFADGRDQVRFQVEQAYANLISNSSNIGTTGQAVEEAKEAVRLAFLRRTNGVGTELEVRNAISDLTQAQGNRVNAVLGYNRALAGLQRAVTNLPADSITPRASGPIAPLQPSSTAPDLLQNTMDNLRRSTTPTPPNSVVTPLGSPRSN